MRKHGGGSELGRHWRRENETNGKKKIKKLMVGLVVEHCIVKIVL